MRDIILAFDRFGDQALLLGRVGENRATRVLIDLKSILSQYPDAIASITVKQPSRAEYPAAVKQEDGILTWEITSADIGNNAGSGQAQITLRDADGTIIKTAIAYTRVGESLGDATAPAPDPVTTWIDKATGTLADVERAGNAAQEVADEVQRRLDNGDFVGPQGPQGPKGETGPIGLQGPKGEKGDKGDRGEKGDTGPQGETGAKGDAFTFDDFTPEQLESLRGPKGDTGATGPQGTEGAVGPQGPQGTKGEPGKDAVIDATLTQEGEAADAKAAGDAIAAIKNKLLEKAIESYYAMRRTGKIYGVKIYKFASNPTTAGVRLADAAEMTYAPSTEATAGQDDYIDKAPMFDWVHVNYVRDDDGTARPIAIEGMSDYKTTGAVDVGAMQMSFYVKVVDNADSIEYYVSDTQHEGYTPWCECVKADGTVLPWCIGSAYLSGIASDKLLRSQPNLMIELWQSHNNMITNYQKKGAGYWGAGAARNSFAILMQYIKTANKSSQATWAGCTNYNMQYPAAVESAEAISYFPLTKAQAASLIVGSTVSIGYGYDNSGTVGIDRNNANMYKYAQQARITKIEDLDDTNAAVYLDTDATFTTTKVSITDTLQSPVYLSTYPWVSGTTDKVIGKYDGSWLSNTNGNTPYRIQGREYNLGCYEIASDLVLDCKATGYEVLLAPKGTAHSNADATIRSTYTKIGTMPVASGDQQVGDIDVNPTTGAWYITAYGGSATQGMGDRCYGASGQNGTREYLQSGGLWNGSGAGSSFLHCWYRFGRTDWACGAGD